jgi:hypothetical protein
MTRSCAANFSPRVGPLFEAAFLKSVHRRNRSPTLRQQMPSNRLARSALFPEPLQADAICPDGSEKIFTFCLRPKSNHNSAIPARTRGASRSSRTLDRDAMDVATPKDERRFRGRRSRVVLTPRRRRQVSRKYPRGDGDKEARSPGRARR